MGINISFIFIQIRLINTNDFGVIDKIPEIGSNITN